MGIRVPRWLAVLAVINRSAAAQHKCVGWYLGHQVALFVEANLVAFRDRANAFRVQIPFVENALYDLFIALFHHHEHALLGLAEKDFKRLQFGTAENPFSSLITLAQFEGPHTYPLPDEAFGTNVEDDETWTKTTYRVQLDYDLTDDIMLYGQFATGFVAGGFSETCGSVLSCQPYDSEENDNIEIGLKSELLDGRMRLNLAGSKSSSPRCCRICCKNSLEIRVT